MAVVNALCSGSVRACTPRLPFGYPVPSAVKFWYQFGDGQVARCGGDAVAVGLLCLSYGRPTFVCRQPY